MRVVNCVPIIRTGSVTVMARDIGRALLSHGAEVRDMDYRPGQNLPETFPDLMKWMAEPGDGGLLVDINGAIVTSKPAEPFMAARGNRFNSFTFLTDAPLHFPSRFEHWPIGGLVGLVDRSFFDLARFMKFDRPDYLFLPHAGPDIPRSLIPRSARDIDILLIGNIAKIDSVGDHARQIFATEPEQVGLFVDSFENRAPMKTPFEVTRETAVAAKRGYRRKDVALVAAYLEKYLNNMARVEILSHLGGLDVTLVGNIADDTLAFGARVRQLGFVPFDTSLALMERAKILVNVRPGFPNGGHERIFYALSRGAAVLTNASSFLEADTVKHELIRFFEEVGVDARDKLSALLDDLDQGAVDRDAMPPHYESHHTWKQRLEIVLTHARNSRG